MASSLLDPRMSAPRLVLVLTGVLLAEVAGEAPTCPATLQHDVVLGSKADTFNRTKSESSGDCCRQCVGDTRCCVFTFEPSQQACYLKTSNLSATHKPGAVSATVRAPPPPPPPAPVTVAIEAGRRVFTTSASFKSWNIDASANRGFFQRDLNNAKLLYLAKASRPGYLRFGGSGNDGLWYGVGNYSCDDPPRRSCLNGTWFANLARVASTSGAKLVFGLSISPRTPGGAWDPANAEALIRHAISTNVTFAGFELGNEQNSIASSAACRTAGAGRLGMTADEEVRDFAILQSLLVRLYPDAGSRPRIIGPDLHGYHHVPPDATKVKFMNDFAAGCRAHNISLFAVTHHEYIEVDVESSFDPATLDLTAGIAAVVNATLVASGAAPQAEIWAGEIGPHNGGSPGCGTSERWSTFADSFWYLDAMAAKAQHGYSAFCRQNFVGIDYGMVDCATYDPLPDYYSGLLWSVVMGPAVLNASSPEPSLRAYAHCSPAGDGLGVLLINVGRQGFRVTLDGLGSGQPGMAHGAGAGPGAATRSAYHLTATNGTSGRGVALNGKPLVMSGGLLPTLDPVAEDPSSPVLVAGQSIALLALGGVPCPPA